MIVLDHKIAIRLYSHIYYHRDRQPADNCISALLHMRDNVLCIYLT